MKFVNSLFFGKYPGRIWPEMARINPIPEIERQICQRLRSFRLSVTGMTAVEFARRVDIDSNRLSSYEHCRVPLRYELADRVCREFNVCQRWLAEGKDPVRYYVSPDSVLKQQIVPRAVFSKVYQQVLKPLLEEHIESLRHLWSGKLPPESLMVVQELGQNYIGSVDAAFVLNRSSNEMAGLIGVLPPDLYQPFFKDLLKTKRGFLLKYRQRIQEWENAPKATPVPSWVKDDEEKRESALTDTSTSAICGEVKRQMPDLLERLGRATEKAGRMSALADYLGKATGQRVPLASVSRWLSGKREPGGEITLLLQRWVELQERQK